MEAYMFLNYNNLWKTLIDKGMKKVNYANRPELVAAHFQK